MELMQTKRGMGRVFLDKRTGYYMSDFYVNGKRFTTSTHTKVEADAQKIHAERWYKAQHNQYQPSRTTRIKMDELFDDLVKDYRTKEKKSIKILILTLDANV